MGNSPLKLETDPDKVRKELKNCKTREKVAEKLFEAMNDSRRGMVTFKEFLVNMKKVDGNGRIEFYKKMFEDYDKNGDRKISKYEFNQTILVANARVCDKDFYEQMLHNLIAFRSVKDRFESVSYRPKEDKERAQDASSTLWIKIGTLDPEELKSRLNQAIVCKASSVSASKAFAEFDKNGDGKISKKEFRRGLLKNYKSIPDSEFLEKMVTIMTSLRQAVL